MQSSVREIAQMLKVSEKTIYRWIHDRKIPSYRVGDLYRFNRAEIAEWATSQRMDVDPSYLLEQESDPQSVSILEALGNGGVFYRVQGQGREAVLQSVVEILPLPPEVDQKYLHEVLVARERLASTGIGDGIAIPHARTPMVLHLTQPLLGLFFLDEPVDFKALDGKPVHTLFALATPTVQSHLHILSRLAYLLKDKTFRDILEARASRSEIMSAIETAEARIPGAVR